MAPIIRRAGKDDVLLHRTAVAAMERPATYWTALPEYAQARKALWTAVNPHSGMRRIDEAFPHEIRESTNESEMFIRFVNGSTWQLIGSDRYNALVGASVAGVTFSEFALANPAAWGYIRPMLEENDGWAAFITTPRGPNHAKSMYELGQKNKNWFAQSLSVLDTGALNEEQLAESLEEYKAIYGDDFGLAMYEQEYLVSFSGATIGAYWGSEISRAERDGRVRDVPIDRDYPVHVVMDLGKAANNPMFMFQVIADRPHIVDFYRPETDDLDDWCKWLDDKGYGDGNTYVPHDIAVTEWGSTRTRLETLQAKGRKVVAIPRVSVADGLQAGRTTINEALIHKGDDERGVRMELGLEGLKNYRREWDDELKVFRMNPVKDWAEHIGSAFRYLGLSWRNVVPPRKKEYKSTEQTFQIDEYGRMRSNMSVKEAVDAMIKRKRAFSDD